MEKTICITPHKFGLGGPASFQSRLARVLVEKGYTLNYDPLDPTNSVILVIGGTRQLGVLRRAKRNGVRIVQRLNGMNWVHRKTRTGLKHFLRAEINNWILNSIRERADRIIYQSRFAQDWWVREYGETEATTRVIFNGVDLEEFNPIGIGHPPADRFRVLMVEGHLGSGYEGGLDSAIAMVQLLNRRLSKKTELMVVGSVPEYLKERYAKSGVDLLWKGVVKGEEIPLLDRSAHLLFSSDVNAACPNSVVEALACGLPVIGYDTGSLPELVVGHSGSIARYGTDPWKLQKPDVHSLADAAQIVLDHQVEYRQAARERAEEAFNIKRVASQYLEVLFK